MFRTILAIFVSCALATGVSAQTGAEVHIPDPALRAAVERALGKEPDAPITVAEMESLTSLDASGGVADLTGLEHASGLTQLILSNNQIADVTPLADLTSLTSLDLRNNQIADVTALADLTSMDLLWLGNNRIADVMPLADLTSLTWLNLYSNQIADVTPLAGLTSLNVLSLYDNQIAEVRALADLTSLISLDAREQPDCGRGAAGRSDVAERVVRSTNNQITDVTPLAESDVAEPI